MAPLTASLPRVTFVSTLALLPAVPALAAVIVAVAGAWVPWRRARPERPGLSRRTVAHALTLGAATLACVTTLGAALAVAERGPATRMFVQSLPLALEVGSFEASASFVLDPASAALTALASLCGLVLAATGLGFRRGAPAPFAYGAALLATLAGVDVAILADDVVVFVVGTAFVVGVQRLYATSTARAFALRTSGASFGLGAVLAGAALVFWAAGGHWVDGEYVPSARQRFTAVVVVPPDTVPDGHGVEVPREGEGRLSVPYVAGAIVYMDDQRVPLELEPGTVAVAPFRNASVAGGYHTVRLVLPGGAPPVVLSRVALGGGLEVALVPSAATSSFRALGDALRAQDADGVYVLREAMTDLRTGAPRVVTSGFLLVVLGALVLGGALCGAAVARVPGGLGLFGAMSTLPSLAIVVRFGVVAPGAGVGAAVAFALTAAVALAFAWRASASEATARASWSLAAVTATALGAATAGAVEIALAAVATGSFATLAAGLAPSRARAPRLVLGATLVAVAAALVATRGWLGAWPPGLRVAGIVAALPAAFLVVVGGRAATARPGRSSQLAAVGALAAAAFALGVLVWLPARVARQGGAVLAPWLEPASVSVGLAPFASSGAALAVAAVGLATALAGLGGELAPRRRVGPRALRLGLRLRRLALRTVGDVEDEVFPAPFRAPAAAFGVLGRVMRRLPRGALLGVVLLGIGALVLMASRASELPAAPLGVYTESGSRGPLELRAEAGELAGRFVVENEGEAPLRITAVFLRGRDDEPRTATYSVRPEGGVLPLHLAPRGRQAFSVRWAPERALREAQLFAQVTIATDRGDHALTVHADTRPRGRWLAHLLSITCAAAALAAVAALASSKRPPVARRLTLLGCIQAAVLLGLAAIVASRETPLGSYGYRLVERVAWARSSLELFLGLDAIGAACALGCVALVGVALAEGGERSDGGLLVGSLLFSLALDVRLAALGFAMAGCSLAFRGARRRRDRGVDAFAVATMLAVGLVMAGLFVLAGASEPDVGLAGSATSHAWSLPSLVAASKATLSPLEGEIAPRAKLAWVLLVLGFALSLGALPAHALASSRERSAGPRRFGDGAASAVLPLLASLGLVRFVVTVLPDATRWGSGALVGAGVVCLAWSVAASAARPWAAVDVLRLGAAGVVLLGAGSLTPQGLAASTSMAVLAAIAQLVTASAPELAQRGFRASATLGGCLVAVATFWPAALAVAATFASFRVLATAAAFAVLFHTGALLRAACREARRTRADENERAGPRRVLALVYGLATVGCAVAAVVPGAVVAALRSSSSAAADAVNPAGPEQITKGGPRTPDGLYSIQREQENPRRSSGFGPATHRGPSGSGKERRSA